MTIADITLFDIIQFQSCVFDVSGWASRSADQFSSSRKLNVSVLPMLTVWLLSMFYLTDLSSYSRILMMNAI
jgi:hypothetical protein